jgi:hypothetical protein
MLLTLLRSAIAHAALLATYAIIWGVVLGNSVARVPVLLGDVALIKDRLSREPQCLSPCAAPGLWGDPVLGRAALGLRGVACAPACANQRGCSRLHLHHRRWRLGQHHCLAQSRTVDDRARAPGRQGGGAAGR